jgi:nicotinamide-nucleotide amidase
MSTSLAIAARARRVAELLTSQQRKVAFAESCTGGLVSGALTAIPGISAWHCGGVIVYRNETKQALLTIPANLLDVPGPVSEPVARLMAERVLAIIPEADVSLAITGHLGPHAPPELDGLVFIAAGIRARKGIDDAIQVQIEQLRLPPKTNRLARQKRAVEAALSFLASQLEITAT